MSNKKLLQNREQHSYKKYHLLIGGISRISRNNEHFENISKSRENDHSKEKFACTWIFEKDSPEVPSQ
jgi:hypothetical protein